MPRFLGSLFSRRHDEPGRANNPKSIRESGPIIIAAVGYDSADVADVLNPSNSDPPAGWQATAESGRRIWVYSKPDLKISFKFIDTSRAQLDDTLQGDITAVLFVGNLACYDQPHQQATSYIQDLLNYFAALRNKIPHLPMILILRGANDFRARQQESPIYRCFPDGDGDSTHESGEVAGMKLLVRKIDEASGSDKDEGELGKRGELYLHFVEDKEGGALEMRFVAAAAKEILLHAVENTQ
ncbi:hypothetical protein PspLS_09230 [Pyricularia sp. CBS 133598]|nr:hypothetical protein PspLS_09230 [Pyricularia sp. CBS 133598]